jgi:hypothetical protein
METLLYNFHRADETPPAPLPAPPEIVVPEPTVVEEPDKTVSETNAGKAEEKRRLLAALPKATKTTLAQTGSQGTVQRKTLLGAGGTGSASLG